MSAVSPDHNPRQLLPVRELQNVGGVLQNQDATNGDVYLVATKTMTQTKRVPVLLNFGVKATNASIWGIAGNAPACTGGLKSSS